MDTFRNDVARLEGAITELGERMERRFDRTIGLQFAILIVIITGLFGVLTKLLD